VNILHIILKQLCEILALHKRPILVWNPAYLESFESKMIIRKDEFGIRSCRFMPFLNNARARYSSYIRTKR